MSPVQIPSWVMISKRKLLADNTLQVNLENRKLQNKQKKILKIFDTPSVRIYNLLALKKFGLAVTEPREESICR